MNEKLATDATFPDLMLNVAGGGTLTLSTDLSYLRKTTPTLPAG